MVLLKVAASLLLLSYTIDASPYKIPDSQIYPYFRSANVPQGRQVVFRNAIADQTLPCPNEGYFVHPKNCSQFYRCVDYLGIGQVFSRYLFHCPKDHVFIIGKDTCVPGRCSELTGITRPIPSPVLITTAPLDVSPTTTGVPAPPPTTTAASEIPSTVPQTDPPSPPIPSQPVPQAIPLVPPPPPKPLDIPFPQGNPPQPPTTTVRPVTVAPVTETECAEGMYEQHSRYCNVYHPCGNNAVNYACNIGTAFDFQRQMCIVDQFGELCNGKELMQINHVYKSIMAEKYNKPVEPSTSQNAQVLQYAQYNPAPITHYKQIIPQEIFAPQVAPIFFQNPNAFYNSYEYNHPQRVTVFK